MSDQGQARHSLFHSGAFPSLEKALWRELRAVRQAEPLAPVLVLVPTNLLRRHLGVAAAEQGGCLNVHFLTLIDLARQAGGPALAARGRAALPRFAGEVVARAACRGAQARYFASIAARPGFHRALLATIDDFKEAGHAPADLARPVAGPLASSRYPGCPLASPRWRKSPLLPKLKDLQTLWTAYEERLGELGLYDDADLLAAAAAAAPHDPWLAQAAAVMVYGFYDLNELQRRLVDGCTAGRRACAFFPFEEGADAFRYAVPTFEWFRSRGFEPHPEPCQALTPLQRRLFAPPSGEAGEPAQRLRIIAAPDEIREVRAILRSAIEAAREGLPLARVGVLLRQAATYAPLFAEECLAGGLDAYHHDPPPLSASRAGRSLLMLLRLVGSDLGRADVMEFLTYADVPFDRPVSPADWDLLSMQAGIVSGRESWARRLAARRRGLLAEAEEEDETRAREQIASLEALEAFLGPFFDALEAVPLRGGWKQLVDAVLDVFRTYVRDSDERQEVAEQIAGLAALDATGEPADLPTLARLAREALEGRRAPHAKFGSRGPAVVDLMEGRGLSFDLVFIPGLVEKGFPAAPTADPLLADGEREALGLGLPLKAHRAAEEQLLFRLAVGAGAGRVVLSYPRMEPSSGRERVPSHFLLRAVEAVTGQRCNYRGLKDFGGHLLIPASAFSPSRPEEAWREAEYDLSVVCQALASLPIHGEGRGGGSLAPPQSPRERGEASSGGSQPDAGAELAYLAEVSPTFAAALRAESARWGERRFTPYDGVLSDEAALAALAERLGAAPWHFRATDLERYAGCPFRYFLEHILGIAVLEEPEALQRLSGLDRGSLMHRILHRALRRAKREGRLPLRPESEGLVIEVAREGFEEFEQQGRVGCRPLWELERGGLERDLRRFVLDEAADRSGYVPAYFEASFGTRPREEADELSSQEGVLFDLGDAGTVRIVGRIDRIDLDRERTHGRVIDYKTGSARGKPKANSFGGGTALQLPLYLKAAEALLGGATIDEALYRFVTENKAMAFTREAYAEREAELRTILATITEGIRKGRFFAGVTDAPCRNCDFAAACGAAVAALSERKMDDPNYQPFKAMRAIP